MIVEVVLREAGLPLTAQQIVNLAGARLPSRSKTPDTVVARDLAIQIKRLGEASPFVRVAPGLFTMRDLVASQAPAAAGYLRRGEPMPAAAANHRAGTSTDAVGQRVQQSSAS